jgi:hypothetical protein
LSSIAAVSTEEGLNSSDCSALFFAHTLQNASGSGVFYPNGSRMAIESALEKTIVASGGFVLKNVDVKELILEEIAAPKLNDSSNTKPIKATGVRVSASSGSSSFSYRKLYLFILKGEEIDLIGKKSIVSGLGILNTYSKLIPLESISENVRENLSLLKEARPKFYVVYWLKGTAKDLVGTTETNFLIF